MTIREKVVTRLFMLRTMTKNHRQVWIDEIEKGGYLKPYIKSKLTIMDKVAKEMTVGLKCPSVEVQTKTLDRIIDDNNLVRNVRIQAVVEEQYLDGLPYDLNQTFLAAELCLSSLARQFTLELKRMGLLDLFNRYCVAFNEYAKFYDEEIVR